MIDLFTPRASYQQKWTGSIAIISPEHTPTVDFYITSRLSRLDSSDVFRYESLEVGVTAGLLPLGTFVVIVRHTSAAWVAFIEAHKERWSGVAYLMDDDIPNAILCRDIPFDYALWTTGRYLLARKGLARICDRLWLSTKALKMRYESVSTDLMPPQYFGVLKQAAPQRVRRWGYHGTRVHKQEIKWLLPIVEAVQKALPEAEFEVFGDDSVKRQFNAVPRVKVMPAMSWVDYLKYCETTRLAVGLAPMLSGRFNETRSYTKAFDIARCGAVGVFSMSRSYDALEKSSGAFVLPNNQALWVETVINLLQNDDLRINQYQQFSAWVERVSSDTDIPTTTSSRVLGF